VVCSSPNDIIVFNWDNGNSQKGKEDSGSLISHEYAKKSINNSIIITIRIYCLLYIPIDPEFRLMGQTKIPEIASGDDII
jgi:hypothetical protein